MTAVGKFTFPSADSHEKVFGYLGLGVGFTCIGWLRLDRKLDKVGARQPDDLRTISSAKQRM
jgi:hypothetical protein